MTFSPMFPYMLSICIIILGTIPSLFVPETLPATKSKRANRDNPEQEGQNELPQPLNKRPLSQELSRRAGDFIQSTHFIWGDSNVCLMILVLFVTIMNRSCTNLLLQYVSKKFDWSIGRVCTYLLPWTNKKTNYVIGQSVDLSARDFLPHNIPAYYANSDFASCQIPESPREIQRPIHEQR